ncbi:glycogen/starch/alpha-glucan phosphorylase [Pseudoflavonifractor phocaeensis]|uniref:glycogen/starch/alpha-glucan phosphorylase n=1 Tax=Pseudoflavonifractor phocaeensis TaxID=1870988 RepID=UPI001F26CD1D|nr:glycogen/starch/alpha-glucan phosphorylase [Pseudoflavonifractor phocaeensis]MCF2595464.1 glycogen/starch/alpha-glucan family phosphorylase [Pseudoflavonifractor phocaeensis]
MELKERLFQMTQERFGRSPDQCSDHQLYEALLLMTRRMIQDRPAPQTGRKLYYFSAEFLMGKLLSNNLLALGLYDQVRSLLFEMGRDLGVIESEEPEPSLGNGGLGRLAACFLDSIAALGLPGDGVGLNYHYGLFHQKFAGNKQTEEPDPWLEEESWLIPTGRTFTVPFGGFELKAVQYDVAIPGAGNGYANRLHLFDVEQPADQPWVGIGFDKTDIAHNLTSFLYPDDSDEKGQLLRVYQQYFMVSAGAQLILQELEERGYGLEELADHVVVQINDTHPSMVIPELIRLLTQRGMSVNMAIDQVSRTCAYTNHTILAEALEKWPLAFIRKVAPQLVPIILELDQRVKEAHPDPRVAIIDGQERVHMAHMDIHYGFSVNGVAALHTEILKNSELKPFCDLYPQKFNNKTNGVTFRRWLEACDPELAALIDDCIGSDWRRDTRKLEGLLDYQNDKVVLDRLLAVKQGNKDRLCRLLWAAQGVELDPDSVFDIQIKRLHEYKRQQMNALYIIYKYLEIKSGKLPERPVTVIFGAKAAPAYVMAKHIIHLILTLQQLIEQDPQVRPWLRVAMVENYNVTWAESLIPACDISEQISLASKEASGTGNMKFMANGAVTLGTLDGANVEIAQLVGPENIYTFGAKSDEVIRMYAEGSYRPLDYYHRPGVERLVDFLVSPELLAIGDPASLSVLWKDMKSKDWFMALLDVEDYIAAKERAVHDYGDRHAWARKMLVNIAKSGYFSSDRTIQQYDEDIWHLK